MANKSYKEQAGIQSENDQAEGQAVGQGEALKQWHQTMEQRRTIWQGASGEGLVKCCRADQGEWRQVSKRAGEGQVTETELKGVTVGQEGAAGCGSEVTWRGEKVRGHPGRPEESGKEWV